MCSGTMCRSLIRGCTYPAGRARFGGLLCKRSQANTNLQDRSILLLTDSQRRKAAAEHFDDITGCHGKTLNSIPKFMRLEKWES
jgi:hypothetical protein